MPIISISIQNYKSLRSVSFTPKPLSVIVGANAAGKTNFADCLDFISEVYEHGLEVAVSRKGGYENIAFRRQQRSKLPIRVHVIAELPFADTADSIFPSELEDDGEQKMLPNFRIEHSFEFATDTTAIRSQFKLTREDLSVKGFVHDTWQPVARMSRNGQEASAELNMLSKSSIGEEEQELYTNFTSLFGDFWLLKGYSERMEQFSTTELIVVSLGRFITNLLEFIRLMESIKVFQISPMKSREPGVPSPNPELERLGGNLPAIIDEIQKNQPDAWDSILKVMRAILPNLENIEINYTSSKRLGLFFREKGYRKVWSVEEVSDGTLQTLALLVTIFDPNSTLLVLEEVENSVHPWIIRRVVEACREAAASKQIILTTHSPVVIDAVAPEDIWVIWRENGESHLKPLLDLNQELLDMWTKGKISTFEYIDSGALPLAIPPAPSDETLLTAN
jgi:predicted ATPase